MHHACEQDVLQIQLSRQRLQARPFGSVARDHERDVRQLDHGAQKLIDAFLGREAAEVKQVSLIRGELFLGRKSLEVRQDFDASRWQTAGDQFIAYEFARSQENVDAVFVGSQPFVQVCLGGKNHGARSWAGVTTLGHGVVERAVLAVLRAGAAIGNKIVGWAQDLKIVDVVDHGNPLTLEFPKNRGRQMVIDSADMSQVREKSVTHPRIACRAEGE